MSSQQENENEVFVWEDDVVSGGQNVSTPVQEGEHIGRAPWNVVIIDDDQDVHHSTRFALDGTVILGRTLKFHHAYTAQQGRLLLEQMKQQAGCDIGVIFLDVVMETDTAGLDLIPVIRGELELKQTRIILHTGQPGYAPEQKTMLEYDINDYKTKSELTHQKLVTVLTSALRSYDQICSIEANRRGLELIVRSTGSLMSEHGLQAFAAGVITQLSTMLGTIPEGLVCALEEPQEGRYTILAAAGRYASVIAKPLEDLPDEQVRQTLKKALDAREPVYTPRGVALFFGGKKDANMAAFIETNVTPNSVHQQLLDVFCSNLNALVQNQLLVEQLEQVAFFDALVGLTNRLGFANSVVQSLQGGVGWCVGLIDIDDFSDVNDLMGHSFADKLLKKLAQRLMSHFGKKATLGRIGPDTFGILMSSSQFDPQEILEVFSRPIEIDEQHYNISATMGVVDVQKLYPKVPVVDGQRTIETQIGNNVIKDASIVLKRAKKEHKGSYLMWSDDIVWQSKNRAHILSQLRASMDFAPFHLVYQPQVNLNTGALEGLEALVRWSDDTGKLVPPDQFIPIAEQSGLIHAIGLWVLETACRYMKQLVSQGSTIKTMAVNVSAVQLKDNGFIDKVFAVLKKVDLDPAYLELEITESAAALPTEQLRAQLRTLRQAGVSVAIDDFGTGYSSLSYLEGLPLDRIKIDKSFVMSLENNPGRLVEVIVQLGKSLGLQVLAEGIENEKVAQLLQKMGCDQGQGYGICRPVDAQKLNAFLEQYQAQEQVKCWKR